MVDQEGKKPKEIVKKLETPKTLADIPKKQIAARFRKEPELAERRGVEISELHERKERARETIAFILVFGFLTLLISSLFFAGTIDEAIKLIQSISASLSGMIGAILGYYYGTTRAETPTTTKTT